VNSSLGISIFVPSGDTAIYDEPLILEAEPLMGTGEAIESPS
jgi:hypothetical protein